MSPTRSSERSPTDRRPKISLVTGAASGIGQEIATQLLAKGQRVLAVDKQEPSWARGHERLRPLLCDLAQPAEVEALLSQVADEAIDQAVFAAGYLVFKEARQLSAEDIHRSLATNFTGHALLMSRLGGAMAQRLRGSMVVIGSNADVAPRLGMAAYGASKAALTLFARSLALELAADKVRINIVAPGTTKTPMLTAMGHRPDLDEAVIAGDLSRFKLGIPLGRLAEPVDIAQAVLFLLSDEARHITMQKLVVDGGATLGAP